MPDLDGLELARLIRQSSGTGYVYIILLTGRTTQDDIVTGLQAGADDYIVKPFDPRELQVRVQAGERIIQLHRALDERNAELRRAVAQLERANERMRGDLLAAADFQRSLLPQEPPHCEQVRFSWLFQPCDELAGDIFGLFRLDEHHIGLYILDVSGHGVRAALLSVTLNRLLTPLTGQGALLKQLVDDDDGYRLTSPVELANLLNRRFPLDLETGQYFTIWYGILDTSSGELRFVSAGHPPLLYSARGRAPVFVRRPSMPIGFAEQPDYVEQSLQLCPGDRVLLYSDGVSEAMNNEGESFGEERMAVVVEQSAALDLDACLRRLIAHIDEWRGKQPVHDDISMLALEWVGAPPTPADAVERPASRLRHVGAAS